MRQAGSNTNAATFWRELFSNWPEQRPRRGLIITAWLEHIPFEDYLISEAVLFLSRSQPDGLNARKVMIPFEQIVAVKFPDVFELDAFASAGFGRTLVRKDGGAGPAGREPGAERRELGAVEQVGLVNADDRQLEQPNVDVAAVPPLDEPVGSQSTVVGASEGNEAAGTATEDCHAVSFKEAETFPVHCHVDCLGVGVGVADDVEQHAGAVGPPGGALRATVDESEGPGCVKR